MKIASPSRTVPGKLLSIGRVSAICLAAMAAPSWGADFTWNSVANGSWGTSGNWITDASGVPGADDNIFIDATGAIQLSGSRDITDVTSRVAGASMIGNLTGQTFLLTISNQLTVNNGASLQFRNGNTTTLSVSVEGDVALSGELSLGGSHSTANLNNALTAFEVAGSTTLFSGGTLNIYQSANWSPTTPLALGDLSVASGAAANLSQGTLNGNYTRTVNARSLSGAGIIRTNSEALAEGSTRVTTLQVTTAEATDADFSGVLEDGAAGNTLNLMIAGTGQQTLSGVNTYTGSTQVQGGSLLVDGSIAASSGVEVFSGATLGGHGTVAAISGAGTVGPGNSPGILTAPSVDGSGGLDFVFEITQALPDFADAANSGNDLLRLTDATPFLFALDSNNTVTVDFSGLTPAEGIYLGGFYVDSGDFLSEIENANFQFVGLSGFEVSVSTIQQVANFDGGVSNGYITRFTVTAIPEPGSVALVLLSSLGLLAWRRRGLAARV